MNTDIYGIIKENEWIIYNLAYRYKKYYNMEDLYQVGTIGIIKAYKNYKDFNVKFSSYAYKYVLGEIVDYIKNDRNIKINDEYMKIYKKYLNVKELLNNKYNREVSFSEICSFMNINESDMVNIIETVSFTLSSDNEELNIENYIDDREKIDNKIILKNCINELNDFDKNIINYRYFEGYTQSEIAQMLGISQVKVSREEKEALLKLKRKIAA